MADRINLPLVPAELQQLTGKTYPYRRLYMRVLDGVIPSERDGVRIYVNRSDLPAIAATLGLIAENHAA